MSSTLQDGSIFAGRYRVVRNIATGGMGAVYEVVHLETERRRALKVMLPHMFQSAELRERFKREARVAAHIESEFIVDVFDAGVDEATEMPFLVMELLRGEELGKRLKRIGRFAAPDVVTYLHQTALALDKTHRASIVHRDLKPENLFLTEREGGPPTIKVLDFGVAKLVADSATNADATCAVGTPLYMSPEQFSSDAKITGTSDIYALGMLAYTLLVGKPYWAEDLKRGNVFAFAAIAVKGPREAPTARAAAKGVTLPPAFDPWFWQVTALNPAHRFASATAAITALAEVLGTMPPTTSPSISQFGLRSQAPVPSSSLTSLGASLTGVREPRRNGALLGVALAVGVVMVGGGTYLVRSVIMRPSPPTASPEDARGQARAASPSPLLAPSGSATTESTAEPAASASSTPPQLTPTQTSKAIEKAPSTASTRTPSTPKPPSTPRTGSTTKKPPPTPVYSQD